MDKQPPKYRPELGRRFDKGVVTNPEVWVVRQNGTRAHGAELVCDCGNVYQVIWNNLTRVRSCGCWYRQTRQAGGETKRRRRDAVPVPPGMKLCARHKELHPIEDFGADSRASDGKQSTCLAWYRDYQLSRQADPVLRETDKARMRLARPSYRGRRRARQKNSEVQGPVPPAVYAAVLASGPCVYCGAPAACVDHITPLHRGGHEAEYNLVPSCNPCNWGKQARLLRDWDREKVDHAITRSPKVAAQFIQQEQELPPPRVV